LVNKDKYTTYSNAQMDIADEKLLEEDILAPQDSKRYYFTFNIKTKSVVCFKYNSIIIYYYLGII